MGIMCNPHCHFRAFWKKMLANFRCQQLGQDASKLLENAWTCCAHLVAIYDGNARYWT
jgi:hypothetical protein